LRFWIYYVSELPKDKDIAKLLFQIMPDKKSKEFNWALLDYSTMICSRNPKCNVCFAKE
jgi:adenine-specific DNA glycosylase